MRTYYKDSNWTTRCRILPCPRALFRSVLFRFVYFTCSYEASSGVRLFVFLMRMKRKSWNPECLITAKSLSFIKLNRSCVLRVCIPYAVMISNLTQWNERRGGFTGGIKPSSVSQAWTPRRRRWLGVRMIRLILFHLLAAEVKCLMKDCLLVDKWHADTRPVHSTVEYGVICWLWKSVSLKMADRNVYENVLHFKKRTKAYSGKEKRLGVTLCKGQIYNTKQKDYIVFCWRLPSFLCLSLSLIIIIIIITFLSLLPKTITQESVNIEITFKLRCISLVNSITYSIGIHPDIPSSSFFFLSIHLWFFFLIHIWRQCASNWPYYK